MVAPNKPLTGAISARRAPRRFTTLFAIVALLAAFEATALSQSGLPPLPPDDAQLDCYQIASEITRLEQYQRGTPGFWSRNDNQAAGVMTVVLPIPALGYLGYNAYHGLKKDGTAAAARDRIRTLRSHSARKQCFVR